MPRSVSGLCCAQATGPDFWLALTSAGYGSGKRELGRKSPACAAGSVFGTNPGHRDAQGHKGQLIFLKNSAALQVAFPGSFPSLYTVFKFRTQLPEPTSCPRREPHKSSRPTSSGRVPLNPGPWFFHTPHLETLLWDGRVILIRRLACHALRCSVEDCTLHCNTYKVHVAATPIFPAAPPAPRRTLARCTIATSSEDFKGSPAPSSTPGPRNGTTEQGRCWPMAKPASVHPPHHIDRNFDCDRKPQPPKPRFVAHHLT
jgi:hypothetical protein